MTDTIIIGVSGKKQSGKSMLCDNIGSHYGLTTTKLHNDVTFMTGAVVQYSFADVLKKSVCMDTLGLTEEQCNGTDEQKNTGTMYKWENLPREIRYQNRLGEKRASNGEICQHILPEGFMTAREILQVVGTDIFRNYLDNDVWVNATMRSIKKDNPKIAIIADVRFPGEVDAVVGSGGYIIRLLRDVCDKDNHSSEIALDDFDFVALGEKCFVLDNQEMSIEEKNEAVLSHLEKNWEIAI